MTDAQDTALDQLQASRFPVKLHAGTAQSLERRSLIEPEGDGWVLTERGRNHLARESSRKAKRRIEEEFPAELRDRLDRVLSWLKFTKRLQFVHRCRPLIMALLMEREYSFGNSDPSAERRVRKEVEDAIEVVDHFLTTNHKAISVGGNVSLDWSVEKPNPLRAKRRRQSDIAAAAEDDGAISLAAYRERRRPA